MIFSWQDLVGKKVIVRSNENEITKTGTFMTFDPESKLPIVLIDGKEMLVAGIIAPYSNALYNTLVAVAMNAAGYLPHEDYTVEREKQGGKAAWEWLANIVMCHSVINS
jgi:hypothetical protein